MAAARRILLVAYFYPPCKDTGAHRPAALAKYLRRLGHEVTVLTTSAYGNGAEDEADVVRTADAQTLRAKLGGGKGEVASLYDADTYSPKPHPLSRVLVPEPLVAAWTPFATTRALRLNGKRRFDCVITTSPPESGHAVGRILGSRGVAWVADLRDAWRFESLRPEFPTTAQRRLDRKLEHDWLGRADVVTCVSEAAAADLRARGIADPIVIANGADPELLEAADPGSVDGILDPERVSLVYTGRFGRGRDPAALVEALARVADESHELAARLELVVAGPLTGDEDRLLARDVSPARIVRLGPLARERALALQRAADALVVIAEPWRSQLANFKVFEYLATGLPIVGLAEGTEAARIVAAAGGVTASAEDADAIAAILRQAATGELPPPDPEAGSRYAYPGVAAEMAAAIEQAIGRASSRSA